LGQAVLVDNRSGADGNLAIQYVAQAKPDGQTLLLVNPTVVYNHMITALEVDALTVLDPLAKVTEYSLVLLQSASRSPVNLQEFVAWAKTKPGGLNCGGGGGAPTIACHMLKAYGNVPLTVVPYKGNAPAMRDLMGGHLDIMFDMSNSAAAQLGNSKVVALATTAEGRSEAPFTQLPVLNKTMPQFKLSSWLGMFLPAGVPAEQTRRLDLAMKKVLTDPDLVARLADGGLTVKYENPQQFRASLASDRKHYELVFRDLKMGK
jgi:tripartite-type tricarboxylate transporter receptor subunit TctC